MPIGPPTSLRVTRGVLEALAEQQGLSVTIISKSPLVTRDIDLLVRIAARSRLSVHISLITADRELARRLEPRAPTPEARLRAIARLRANGIEVGVNVMPVLPGITDAPHLLESLVRAVAESNASYLGACGCVCSRRRGSGICHSSRPSFLSSRRDIARRTVGAPRSASATGRDFATTSVRCARNTGSCSTGLQGGRRRRGRAERRRCLSSDRSSCSWLCSAARTSRRTFSHGRRRAVPDTRRETRRHSPHRAPDRAFRCAR